MIEKIVQLMDIIVLITKGDYMVKYRLFIFIFFVMILCGCDCSYKLKIDDNNINENISINVIGLKDSENIINKDYYPFHNNLDIIYSKDILNKDNGSYLNLQYNYKPDDFINSVAFCDCFENRNYENNDKYYYFKMSNLIECYYGFDYDIVIETKNKVSYSNADNTQGDLYIWHVTDKNRDKILIEIKILKGQYRSFDILIIICSLLFVIVAGILIYILYKKKRNSCNEI